MTDHRRAHAAAINDAPPTASEVLHRAATLANEGRFREAIDYATCENRRLRDAAIEHRLVRWRNEAFDTLQMRPRSDWPPVVPDLFDGIDGVPEIPAEKLDAYLLAAGIFHHGCLIVRGLVPRDEAVRLADGISRAYEARDAALSNAALSNAARPNVSSNRGSNRDVNLGPGNGPSSDSNNGPNNGPDSGSNSHASSGLSNGLSEALTWFAPFEAREANVKMQRAAVRKMGGAAWTADSPRVLFDLIEAFERHGVIRVVERHLGERPILSVQKATMRIVPCTSGTDWHQDGAFLGGHVRAVNVWLALSDCGVDAPGLDIIPRRFNTIVETGTHGAKFGWSVGPGAVTAVSQNAAVVSPVFSAGDAVMFDHLCLHRTGVRAGMTKSRWAAESWLFAPSAKPDAHHAIVL